MVNESFEMTMPLLFVLSVSMPRMADAKLDKSDRVVEEGNEMASVLDDGRWNSVRLISSPMMMLLFCFVRVFCFRSKRKMN